MLTKFSLDHLYFRVTLCVAHLQTSWKLDLKVWPTLFISSLNQEEKSPLAMI